MQLESSPSFAAAFPLNILAELTNIVALAYLILMSLGIIKLRKMMGMPKKGIQGAACASLAISFCC